MSKRLHIILSDDTHIRMRRLATESGLTNAKLVELGIQVLEEQCGPALRQMRVGVDLPVSETAPVSVVAVSDDRTLPPVELTFQPSGNVDSIATSTVIPADALDLTADEQAALDRGESVTITADPEPDPTPETAPTGQPAGKDDDDWWMSQI